MELVAHLRLSKQALIDLAFFCGVPVVLAMLSAALGPYIAIKGAAGAAVYVAASQEAALNGRRTTMPRCDR